MEELEIVSPYVETGQELLNFNLFQFPNDASLFIQLTDDCKGFGLTLKISSEGDSKARYVTISLSPILLNWKYPYSFIEFRKKFIQVLDSNDNTDKFVQQHSTGVIEIIFTHEFSQASINDEITPYIKQIEDVYDKTIELLQIEKSTDSLTASFDFPEEIKIYCSQYLEYFAQFLLDIGINATSSIKEEAGKVLFSVTPTDKTEALDKIREMLAVYLNLPSSPIVYNDSFAAMRLQQQKGQENLKNY